MLKLSQEIGIKSGETSTQIYEGIKNTVKYGLMAAMLSSCANHHTPDKVAKYYSTYGEIEEHNSQQPDAVRGKNIKYLEAIEGGYKLNFDQNKWIGASFSQKITDNNGLEFSGEDLGIQYNLSFDEDIPRELNLTGLSSEGYRSINYPAKDGYLVFPKIRNGKLLLFMKTQVGKTVNYDKLFETNTSLKPNQDYQIAIEVANQENKIIFSINGEIVYEGLHYDLEKITSMIYQIKPIGKEVYGNGNISIGNIYYILGNKN